MAVLAPALVIARNEINVRWPDRDRRTDGWIGDTSHQESGRPENGGSDHNPNRRNVVNALDIDVDGIDCPAVIAAAIRHPSTHYVIWAGKIWSREYGFVARVYKGTNPHNDHIHLSLTQSPAAENSTVSWNIAAAAGGVKPVSNPGQTELPWAQRLAASMPVIRQDAVPRGSVRKLQALINVLDGPRLVEDGVFGPVTATAVQTFQGAHGLAVDAIVGPKTWAALLGELPTLRQDATGVDVRRIQALLNVSGQLAGLPELEEDGVFGPVTWAAVRAFQARHGLAVDGIVGPVTWSALLTR